jgi:hypothetical protein
VPVDSSAVELDRETTGCLAGAWASEFGWEGRVGTFFAVCDVFKEVVSFAL